MPAADEVWRLHHRDGPECDLFRVVAEQGHYAGRTEPSDTRQGIYAFTPSGRLLDSVNTRDPRRIAALLDNALRRWDEMPDAERYLDPPPDAEAGLSRRAEGRVPTDGLILHIHARDLPRAERNDEAATEPGDRRGRRRGRSRWKQYAWNQDHVWFRAAEMRSLVPAAVHGAEIDVPERLARRLARLHFVDNVRGQVTAFEDDDVVAADLRTRVIAVDDERVVLLIEGRTRAVAPGHLMGAEAAASRRPEDRPHGVETAVIGRAVWLREAQRFEQFDVVALGTRWGGTRYNGREHDLDEAPIGFAITLAADEPPVAPAFLWKYGW